MDSQNTAAARALAAGDPIGALKRVALRTMRSHWRCAGSRWRSSASPLAAAVATLAQPTVHASASLINTG